MQTEGQSSSQGAGKGVEVFYIQDVILPEDLVKVLTREERIAMEHPKPRPAPRKAAARPSA